MNTSMILNKAETSTSKERKIAFDILEYSLSMSSTAKIMESNVSYDKKKDSLRIKTSNISLNKKDVYVFGAGKATFEIAKYIEKAMGARIKGGFINVKFPGKLKRIKVNRTSHPYPSKLGIKATSEILDYAKDIKPGSVILFLLSGGASSLFSLPVEDIPDSDFIETHKKLVNSGANIEEINKVRKHISQVKGGKFASLFSECEILTLAFSDVGPVDISAIGSGPTDSDKSTFKDVKKIVKKHSLDFPESVTNYINKGCKDKALETNRKMPLNSKIYILGSNYTLCKNALDYCDKKNLTADYISWPKKSDVNSVSKFISRKMLLNTRSRPKILILGGESTIKIPEDVKSKGGRNQHLSLSTLGHLRHLREPWSVLCFNSDGNDFLTGVGGAIIDHNSVLSVIKDKLDFRPFLKEYRSYDFLKKINSLVKSDPTGINFSDIIIIVLGINRTKTVKK